jgi:hypothetical protein
MNNTIAHSTVTVLAPVIAGRNVFYHLFYHLPAGDLIAEEVTP